MTHQAPHHLPQLPILSSDEDYAGARAQCPVAKSPFAYEVLRHDEGWALASSKETDFNGGLSPFLDQLGVVGCPYRDEWDRQLVCHNNDEVRAKYREIFSYLLRPGRIVKLQGTVRRLINRILDEIPDPSNVNFLTQIAWRIPTLLFCDLVSAPYSSESFVLGLSEAINPPIFNLEKENMPASEKAYFEGLAFMREHLKARRDNLTDDFASELIRLELDGKITADEAETVAMSLLMASMDNTMHQIALSFGVLLEDRNRWEQVLTRPDAAPKAAEETFRLLPRFNVLVRRNLTEVDFGNLSFPEHSWFQISVRSAGRDERKFPQAHEFRLDRDPARQMMFGSSNYSCLGASLARLEVTEAIKIIATRFPNIRLIRDWKHEVRTFNTEAKLLDISLI